MREDLSDISDEDAPSRPPQLAKPVIRSFRVKNEADLFGLGLDELAPRDSSEEGEQAFAASRTLGPDRVL